VIKDNRVVYVEYVVGIEGEIIRRDYPDMSVEDVIQEVRQWQQRAIEIMD
jgi:hypothetical protein